MHVVVAPDKFKGSLTAREVADRVAAGIAAEAPECRVVRVPVADGGDGTVDAALAAGFERVAAARHRVRPASRSTPPSRCATGVAVVEMADVSGLRLLPPDRLARARRRARTAPARSSRAALDQGCRTHRARHRRQREHRRRRRNAGGARVLGCSTPPGTSCPAAAARSPTWSGSTCRPAPRLAETRVVVACDVDNPLLGPHGAAAVYGPQKGASPDDVALLDAALARWADVRRRRVDPGDAGRPRPPGRRGRRRRRLRGHGRARRASSNRGSG